MKILLLLVLLGSCIARDEAFFASLRNTEFGKTILQTLQVSLGYDHPADQVVNLLKQMKDDLNNEQRVEDEELQINLKSSTEQSDQAKAIASVAAEKKAEDEQRLPLLRQEQADKLQQYEEKQGEEQRNLDRIALLTQQRAQSRKDYETRRDELFGLIAALQEAKQILSQGIPQLKASGFAELKSHHQNFMKYYPEKRGFHTLVNLLLQLLQDESSIGQKVLQIIDTLVDSIFEVQKQELKQDDGREQDFLTQQERFLLANRRLAGSLADLLSRSENIKQRLLEVQNDIETQNAIISNKQTEQNDWDQTAYDTQKSYQVETDNRQFFFYQYFNKNRKEQLDIILQIIEILETRFDQETQAFIQRLRI